MKFPNVPYFLTPVTDEASNADDSYIQDPTCPRYYVNLGAPYECIPYTPNAIESITDENNFRIPSNMTYIPVNPSPIYPQNVSISCIPYMSSTQTQMETPRPVDEVQEPAEEIRIPNPSTRRTRRRQTTRNARVRNIICRTANRRSDSSFNLDAEANRLRNMRITTYERIDGIPFPTQWETGFNAPVGNIGRKLLLKEIRDQYAQDPTGTVEKLNEFKLDYTKVRFMTVEQLHLYLHALGKFDFALKVAMEFGSNPRRWHQRVTTAAQPAQIEIPVTQQRAANPVYQSFQHFTSYYTDGSYNNDNAEDIYRQSDIPDFALTPCTQSSDSYNPVSPPLRATEPMNTTGTDFTKLNDDETEQEENFIESDFDSVLESHESRKLKPFYVNSNSAARCMQEISSQASLASDLPPSPTLEPL